MATADIPRADARAPAHRPKRAWLSLPWLGGLFIACIAAIAGVDVWHGYGRTIHEITRELDSLSRMAAEQTAASVQTVDRMLQHVAEQVRTGALDVRGDEAALHGYLHNQSIGLMQVAGLSIIDAQGRIRASSRRYPQPDPRSDVSALAAFQQLKAGPDGGLMVVGTMRGINRPEDWIFPLARRLEGPDGAFAGVVAAGGRVAHFERFYRGVQFDEGTAITLMHRDGTLIARYPARPGALGKRFPDFDAVVARASGQSASGRMVSPVDGVDRFGAVHLLADYPLAVVVTRDAAVALAGWRRDVIGMVARMLALALLAIGLLVVVQRQFQRLARSRASLEISRERYALAVAGSDDGVWDWDYRTGMAFESVRARELQGLPTQPELQPLQALVDSLRVHPDDAARRAESLRAHLAGEAPAYECEYRVRHDDGQYRWIRVRALCIHDAQGQPVRMAGSVSDIDTRKRAEQALRESEERFALAMAGADDGILDWDIVADRLFVSEGAARLCGLEPDEPVRTRAAWTALILPRLHPDDVPRLTAELRSDRGNPAHAHDGQFRVLGADGEHRWVRFRGRLARDAAGRAIRWSGSMRDIDGLKKTEEALRRSEQRYQLAVEGSNEGLWDWDLASDNLYVSPRAQELMWQCVGEPQRPRRAWIGMTEYHPDDLPQVRAALSAHLHGRSRHFKVEYRARHGGGPWRWFLQRGIAVCDAEGRPIRMAGSMEEITDRKTAEAERERLGAQLRQAQKLEAIGTLAGGIAHDFNNILAAILGYSEMAQKDAPRGSALHRYVSATISAGMRAKSLVERILAFSRSGMGERVPVHVQSVVGEALDAVAASLPPGIELERRLDCGDAAVQGDPTQVHQVVMNLCSNAVQAMTEGGTLSVTLELTPSESPCCTTRVLPAGRYVRLSVQDTGSGIAPHLLERIFDPFFTTKEVGVGTGLGLSLVHGIVTDLGGGIEIRNAVGTGATFVVYLPWQGSVDPSAGIEETVPTGHGETVLLVDDEPSLVRLGEEMIAALGYEPVGFTSSTEALAAFRAAPARFDVVLSDEAMPQMTGSELALAIRAIRRDIPIVLMSGYVSPAMSQRTRDAGVAQLLVKPVTTRDIACHLAKALRTAA